jgi:hypothetical protein
LANQPRHADQACQDALQRFEIALYSRRTVHRRLLSRRPDYPVSRQGVDCIFSGNFLRPVFVGQKGLKRWLAGQRFKRQESLVWMDLRGRNLSPLPAAAV